MWKLIARGALLLAGAALPMVSSAWVDPARLVAPRNAEREIARVLATGTNVTDFANYDDRAIEKFLAPMRSRPEVLVLGFPDGENEVVMIRPDLAVPNGGRLY